MILKHIFIRSLSSTRSKRFDKGSNPSNLMKKISIGVLGISGALITYDGAFHEFMYTKAIQRFSRSLKTAALITKDYYFVLKQENSENFESLLKNIHLKSANRLLQTCLINGGLYIKVGQGVAAINHILPPEYTDTLSQLQDECLPCRKEEVQKVFTEELGDVPENIFKKFDYRPIAAASLAQVFKAQLNTGEQVAIKVQYHDLGKRFPSDLGTIIFLQDIVEFFFKNYNFGWILKDVRKNLEMELDFCNEGRNSEKCAKDLQKLKYVYVPKVYWNLTKKRVLTMEWVNGIKITDIEELKHQKIDLKDLDLKLFNIFSEQIFNSGFVHADPHPGNIFVRKGPSGNVEIILLDHGLYESLSEEVRKPLCQFWESTVLKDEKKMKESALQLEIKGYKDFAEVLFQVPYDVEDVQIKTKLTDEDIKYMQEIAKNHFDMIMQTLKEMPRNMLFVLRNLNTIRAISREHGDPIDRPKTMARYAQKCLCKNYTFIGFVKWLYRRIYFEYCLKKRSIKFSLITLYIDMLHKLGRSSKGSKDVMGGNKFYK